MYNIQPILLIYLLIITIVLSFLVLNVNAIIVNKTDFIVKAEGSDYTNAKEVSIEEMIGGINNLSKALESIPNVDVVVKVDENGTRHIVNKTLIYENGTKKIVNMSGLYRNASDDNP